MASLAQAPRALDFIYSEANGWRSREKGVIGVPLVAATGLPYMPGTLLWLATDAADAGAANVGKYYPVTVRGAATPIPADQVSRVSAILGYAVDTRDGDVEAMILKRDAEVNDAYLLYAFATTGGLAFTPEEVAAVNAALLDMNIITRLGVLQSSLVAPPIAPVP
jgi:Bacteriophage lambda head decoration protein D